LSFFFFSFFSPLSFSDFFFPFSFLFLTKDTGSKREERKKIEAGNSLLFFLFFFPPLSSLFFAGPFSLLPPFSPTSSLEKSESLKLPSRVFFFFLFSLFFPSFPSSPYLVKVPYSLTPLFPLIFHFPRRSEMIVVRNWRCSECGPFFFLPSFQCLPSLRGYFPPSFLSFFFQSMTYR